MLLLAVEQGRRKAKSCEKRREMTEEGRAEGRRLGAKAKSGSRIGVWGLALARLTGATWVKVLTGKKSVMKNVV